ncbi:MAG: inosamine-phosphate amidinotransferase 1 [Alphaproteobacteria bacterium]|nr:inosamine-phosphate amidinotransferase 1 [Alphaproteobacteria bacterium]
MSVPVPCSHNEWDPLEEVIVGSALHARLPLYDGGMNRLEPETKDSLPSLEDRFYPDFVIEETEEDLAALVAALEGMGVRVRRPDPIRFDERMKTPLWESDYYFQYPPRDILLMVGDLMIETPSPFRSRQYESWAYRRVLLEYLQRGARWVSAPRPMLTDALYTTSPSGAPALRELEPVFDAANVLRMGEDILYLVSCSGNELGAQWLQSTLGEDYRVHLCRDLYAGTHLDTTLALLRPGLVLANPERVTQDKLPAPLKGWDVLYAPEDMRSPAYSPFAPISSRWLGMNLLMVRPDLAIVDAHQEALMRLLERHGITSVPLRLRHGPILAGGFHCVTVDVQRRGALEDYRA